MPRKKKKSKPKMSLKPAPASSGDLKQTIGGPALTLQFAGIFAGQGNWRGCADAYREAFLQGKPKGWDMCYNCISGFTSVLREERFKPTPADMSFLLKTGRDDTNTALVRVQCHFTHGLMLFHFRDRERAAKNYRWAIQVGKNASQVSTHTLSHTHTHVYNTLTSTFEYSSKVL